MGTASATQPSLRTTSRGRLRILIVDGHELIRRGIRSVLEDQPEWRICGEAASGYEGIEKTKLLRPDVVLLDIALPDREASEVIRQIAEACPSVRIVALAMQDGAESAANALGAGASGVVLKSEAPSEFVVAVENVGRGQAFLSPDAVMLMRSQLGQPRTSEAKLTDLTPRELEVLKAIAKGRSNKQVAWPLGISVRTVNAHRANIIRKLKLATYSDLVRFAIRNGVIKTP